MWGNYMSGIDVLKLLTDGTIKKMAIDDAADRAKAGTLRGGSGGWLSECGKYVTGNCPRKVWARYKGYTLEDNTDKELMFSAGHLNEDGVCAILEHSWPHYKREQEVPTCWPLTTAENKIVNVTGRPDIVLCNTDGTLAHGLELKLVSSLWTALEILHAPKVEHLIQSAHYSKQLGIPYTVVYCNRTNWALLSDFALKKVPKENEPGSEVVEYETYKKKIKDGGKTKEITYRAGKVFKTFYRTYPMDWDEHGQVIFFNGQEWITTFITWEGIVRFYELIANMDSVGDCGPPPTPVDVHGESKSFRLCSDKYCSMYSVCKGKKDLSLDTWNTLCYNKNSEIMKSREISSE
jgi:hypothetical protein